MAKIFALLVDLMAVSSNNLEMGEDMENMEDMGEASLPPGWVVRAAGMREVAFSSFGIFVIIKIILFIIITRWWSPPPATSFRPEFEPSST